MDWPNKRPHLTSVIPPNVDLDDIDLHTAQAQNDRRLKLKFESIFKKYARDFTGIGDEVDLVTGMITVNNGHLTGMRDEGDVGDVVNNTQMSGRSLLRALTAVPEDHDVADEDHGAEMNGRSLMRALTVAPEDADIPFDSIEIDDAEAPSDEESGSIAGDEWDVDENIQDVDWTVEGRKPHQDQEEEAYESVDSDDSILCPKENRGTRKAQPIDQQKSTLRTPEINSNIQDVARRSHSLQSASDPAWRAPPLPQKSLFESRPPYVPRFYEDASYAPLDSESIWAARQTKSRRRNVAKSTISPAPTANQNRRDKIKPSTLFQSTSDDSGGPLQEHRPTKPTSLLNSSRTLSKGQKSIWIKQENEDGTFTELPQPGHADNPIDFNNEHKIEAKDAKPGGSPKSVSRADGKLYYVESGRKIISSTGRLSEDNFETDVQTSERAINRSSTIPGLESDLVATSQQRKQIIQMRRPAHRYTKEEDNLLIHLKEVENLTWDQIAEVFPIDLGLTSLQSRYSKYLSATAQVGKGRRKKRLESVDSIGGDPGSDLSVDKEFDGSLVDATRESIDEDSHVDAAATDGVDTALSNNGHFGQRKRQRKSNNAKSSKIKDLLEKNVSRNGEPKPDNKKPRRGSEWGFTEHVSADQTLHDNPAAAETSAGPDEMQVLAVDGSNLVHDHSAVGRFDPSAIDPALLAA